MRQISQDCSSMANVVKIENGALYAFIDNHNVSRGAFDSSSRGPDRDAR